MNKQARMDFGVGLTPPTRPKPRVTLDSVITEPVQGGEAKPIGQVMEPLQRIMAHPDRNRLMAEFFKRYF